MGNQDQELRFYLSILVCDFWILKPHFTDNFMLKYFHRYLKENNQFRLFKLKQVWFLVKIIQLFLSLEKCYLIIFIKYSLCY